MDEETKDLILQLQAQISALGSILIASGLSTEESIKQLSYIAYEKLAPSK